MSWSQYPLDESLERAYCTEYFGEIPESSTHNSRESFAQSSGEWFVNTSAAGSTRVATGNAAMALGAGRAAGLIPQLGAVQAFNRVRTSALPSPKLPVSLDPSTSKNTEVQPKSTNPPTKFFSQSVNDLEMPTIMLLEPQQFGTAAFTFPGLPPSLPPSQVANHSFIPKIDPCSVGFINSNPSKHFELQVSDGNIERDGLTGPCELNALAVARTEEEPEIVTVSYTNSRTPSSMLSRNVSSVRKQNSCAACVADEQKFEQNCSYTSWSHASGAIKSAEAGLRERQQLGFFHTPELTETSSERADNIVGQGARMSKWATTPIGRRDASELEESVDCQCEDRQDEFIERNKIELGRIRGKTSKRSRTAEVHNLSERRRRDRINEKMRALQDLIPNSNKTDKASMLDEAIEYLKTLQLQLQLMSMRTGMRLPPTVIPARMQHLHPLQIPCPPQLPMGLGMAHGMIDMAAATSMRPFIPYPSFPEAAHCESTPSAASAILDAFNQSSLMDSNSSCSTHQYLDLPSQPASMETYNPCMMYPQQHIQSQCAQQLLHLSQQLSMQTKIQQNRQLSFQHLQHINQE